MSSLAKLVRDLCPDGVHYLPVGDLCTIQTGTQLNKDTLKEIGAYPVYNGGIYPSGYHDNFNTEAATIAISQGGASAGFVNWVDMPFYAGAHCYTVKNVSPQALNRYLYFFLKNEQYQIQNAKHGAGIPGLNSKAIKTLQIPLPPLPVQQEIVRILDKFTTLEAELEEELKGRNKQYEYYMEEILSFKHSPLTKYAELSEVATVKARIGWQGLTKEEYLEYGDYYLITGVDFKNGLVDFDNCYYVKEERYNQDTNIQIVNDDVLVTKDGTLGKVAYVKNLIKPATLNSGIFVIRGSNKVVLNKFLYHYLKSSRLMTYASSKLTGGTIKHLNQNVIVKLPIPIPPIPEQERIVAILDCFDLLVNDIAQGLPAEIAARRKQYEYYRNTLLTFKEKTS